MTAGQRAPTPRDELATWRRLQQLADAPERPGSAAAHSLTACGLTLDLSGQRLAPPILDALLELARECDLPGQLRRLFEGAPVNASEHRAALHTRLRALDADGLPQDPEVAAHFRGLENLAERWRQRRLTGFAGQPLQHLVNIGIGGSDLGPRLVCAALAPERDSRFVANMDPEDFHTQCDGLDPGRTLFIVCSKSFGTAETLYNLEQARQWLLAAGCPESRLPHHLLAVTANAERARAAGFDDEHILTFQDWVGGRYSLWSSIGASIALTLGMDGFRALLRGAQAMDQHVLQTPPEHNLAALLGLTDVWNFSFRHCHSLAVLPYAQRLALLPMHLQQLMMESTGKRADQQGRLLGYHTGAVVWGAAGTTGQHSFHQLLHQGSQRVSCDFILPLAPGAPHPARPLSELDRLGHRQLVAHCLAQMQALRQGEEKAALRRRLEAEGRAGDELEALLPQLEVPGRRLFNLLTLPRLDAWHLGALLALYEHRVYCASVLWGINAFDQWGVELGKRISSELLPWLEPGHPERAEQAPEELRTVIAAWHRANAPQGDPTAS